MKGADSRQTEDAANQVTVANERSEGRPQRLAAQRGRERVTEWISELRNPCPPEDVMN